MNEAQDLDINRDARKRDLKRHIFVEPATKEVRPYLVEYIRLSVADAERLAESDLLGPPGHSIAMDIAGALVWQAADEGIENDGWCNQRDEPVLHQLLDVSGALDADANQAGEWQRLFELTEKL